MRHLRGKFGRTRRWRRWVLALLLLIVAGVVGVVLLANPKRIGHLTAALLADLTGADVRIESARFSLDGSLQLRKLELRVPEVAGLAGRLFSAEQVLVSLDVLNLARGQYLPRSLTFIGPELYLTEDIDLGRFNYELLQERRRGSQAQPELPDRLPEVFIRNGRALFGQTEAGQYILLGTMDLSGKLTQSLQRPSAYSFRLQQTRPGDEEGPTLSGQLDLKQQSITSRLEHFAFDTPQRGMLPAKYRAWWDLLEPTGSLPTVRFEYDPDNGGLHAVMEVRDAELTIPYNVVAWRMTGVSGLFTLRGQTIHLTDLRGKVAGVNYQIDGQVQGLTRDAPFGLVVRLNDFTIPETPADLPVMPPEVIHQFNRFSPSGSFNALVKIERAKPADRVTYQGKLSVLGAKLRYAKFPYPLQGVTGELRFSDELAEIVRLHGEGPSGGKVTIRGTIAPPGDGAAVHMEIQALDLPIDEHLDQALKPVEKKVIDLFRDQQAYDRLTELGLVQTHARFKENTEALRKLRWRREDLLAAAQRDEQAITQANHDIALLEQALKAYPFELGGRTNLDITVDRGYGPNEKYRHKVVIDMRGLSVLFKYWPYPFKVREGKVTADDDKVVVEGLVADGLSGARGSLSGEVILPDKDDPRLLPQLRLAAVDVPFDSLLIASIPRPQDRIVRDLGVRGAFDAAGQVLLRDDGEIDFDVLTEIASATARPHGGAYQIEGVAGRVRLGRGRVSILELTGKHGDSTMRVTGAADFADAGARFDLAFEARQWRWEDPFADLLPPDHPNAPTIGKLLAQHKPAGVFDADLNLRIDATTGTQFDLELKPETVELDLRGQRIRLEQIAGRLHCDAQGVDFDQWSASMGQARFSATGRVGLGEGDQREIDLALEVQAPALDEQARALLPANVLKIVDGLELRGAYHVRDARISQQPGPDGKAVFTFDGKVRLREATARMGVPITEMSGELTLRSSRVRGEDWPSLSVHFDADRLRAANRLICPLKITMDNATIGRRLDITRFEGRCYGGLLLGKGDVDLAGTGEGAGKFRVQLTLQDAALSPLLKPPPTPAENASPATVSGKPAGDTGGQLSASLAVQGVPGLRHSWQGRGAMQVRNANMYELPLGLALLQIINLTWPSAKAFDQAQAAFLLDGDLVRFEQLSFDAPTVQIAGAGTMRYQSRALDLKLYSRNPRGADFGPFSDVVRAFKDELLMVHVTGTLDQPQTSVRSFTGIRQSWEQVFGEPAQGQPLPLSSGPSTSGQ